MITTGIFGLVCVALAGYAVGGFAVLLFEHRLPAPPLSWSLIGLLAAAIIGILGYGAISWSA